MRPPFAAGTVAREPGTADRQDRRRIRIVFAGIEGAIAAYRLFADDSGVTHLEPLELLDRPWENGPGEFKGVGGSVLGDASRVMLMRFETGARPGLHRAVPSFAVCLEGEIVVSASDGTNVALAPGDAVRVETTGRGGWQLGNKLEQPSLLAVVQMPPPTTAQP